MPGGSLRKWRIDLIDQYEAPRKAQCGASSVTRNACEYVLRQAKAHTANMNDYKEYTVRVYPSGTRIWHNCYGKPHREDGPAKEYSDGSKIWFKNGVLHREDGPAMEFANGDKCWYLEGEKKMEAEFNAIMNAKKNPCNGKIVEIDGKKYKLTAI
jgi:hypothetical protein